MASQQLLELRRKIRNIQTAMARRDEAQRRDIDRLWQAKADLERMKIRGELGKTIRN